MATTIPGGYYVGPDGEPHDANGNPIKKLSDSALKKARGSAVEMTADQVAAAAALRKAEQDKLEAEEAAEKAADAAKSAGADVRAAAKSAKK